MKRSSDDNDTITAAESRERFIGAVKSRLINPNANRDVDMTIEQLWQTPLSPSKAPTSSLSK